jgi:hypothetical protein
LKLIFVRSTMVNVLEKVIQATKQSGTGFVSKQELEEMEHIVQVAHTSTKPRLIFEEPQAKILLKMLLVVNRPTEEL